MWHSCRLPEPGRRTGEDCGVYGAAEVNVGLQFPGLVAGRAADRAGAVAGGEGDGFVGEEDAVPDVAAAGDRAQRRGAVEAAVDPLTAVAAPLPLHVRLVRPAVGPEQDIGH